MTVISAFEKFRKFRKKDSQSRLINNMLINQTKNRNRGKKQSLNYKVMLLSKGVSLSNKFATKEAKLMSTNTASHFMFFRPLDICLLKSDSLN